MEYFVTGATGFIGSHLVAQLVEAGHEVVALVRTPTKAADLPDTVEVVHGDIRDRASLRDGMAGVDGVFHLAAWYEVGNPDVETAERVNVEGTRNVLGLVDELDVPKAVYTSTLGVFSDTGGKLVDESYRYDGPHVTTYDRTKWTAHYAVAEPMAEAGLPLVTVLPGFTYGPGDRGPSWSFWRTYLEGNLFAISRRTGACWGHVEDTARAHRRAMERGTVGEAYIIAGEPYTLVETFEIAESVTGIPAPRTVPPAVFGLLARVAAAAERAVTPPPQFQSEPLRVLDGVTYWGDNAKATRELGLEHRPFEAGLAETLAYERAQLGV
jgi:nucleoside-diphosphate-sugar epimerase